VRPRNEIQCLKESISTTSRRKKRIQLAAVSKGRYNFLWGKRSRHAFKVIFGERPRGNHGQWNIEEQGGGKGNYRGEK